MTGKALAAALLLSVGLMVFTGCAILSAGDDESEQDYGRRPEPSRDREDAYEVIVYERYNHGGRSESYQLPENMRHRLVDFVGWGLNDKISSIRVGYRVGVLVFFHKDFQGRAQIINNSMSSIDPAFNDEISSLIVFDRDFGEPMGVWLGQGPAQERDFYDGRYPEASRFYPLPEEYDDDELKIKFLEDYNDQAEWAYIAGAGRRGMSRVEAILYEHDKFRGNSISLPSSYRDSRSFFMLKDLGFDRRASSLILRGRQSYRPPREPYRR